MTKERRLAVEMWEQIAERISDTGFDIGRFKSDFCKEHNLRWQHSCWFCQYVRKDCQDYLPSSVTRGLRGENGCQECPIYKYNGCTEDECGCTYWYGHGLYAIVCNAYGAFSKEERIEAAKTIARLLRGEACM